MQTAVSRMGRLAKQTPLVNLEKKAAGGRFVLFSPLLGDLISSGRFQT